jgi:hypothetical protein
MAAASAAALNVHAQTPVPPPAPAPTPTTADLAADIDIVRDALLALHPGLYRYNEPAAIDAGLKALRVEFAAAPDLAQRYLLLSRVLATLRCGHSYANFFNQSRAVQQALFDRPTRLPFHWVWMNGEMVVTSERLGAPELARGTVVTEVNGMASAALLQSLMPYARADGGSDGKRRALLGVRGTDRLETFDIFHGLLHGAPPGGVHRLRVRTPEGAEQRVEAPAWTLSQRDAQLPKPAAPDMPLWQWQMHGDGVAVLTMNSWGVYNSKWDWKAWLNERLDALDADRAARGLVVDIRLNEGGLDCGNTLLARFLREPSTLPQRRFVRFRKTPDHLNTYLDTWDNSFRSLGENAAVFDERFFALPEGNTTVMPSGPRIDKPLLVLTSPTNSSATYAFAQRCKTSGAARLVGQTTGGNMRGINGGAFFFVRLPASGLAFDLPLIGTFSPTPQPDAGVQPDVLVAATAADIAAGRDPVLARALGLIGSP